MKSVKYEFAMLVAAGLLTGCAGDLAGETGSGQSGNGAASPALAVTFGVVAGADTRTAQGTIDVEDLKAGGFGVFAAQHGQHTYVASSVKSDFMYNQQVYWGSPGHWEYEPLKYWPNNSSESTGSDYVSFFAYAPYAADPGRGSDNASRCIVEFSNPDEAGDPWLIYRLGGDRVSWPDQQVDLLWAAAKNRQRPVASSERVALSFVHTLAVAGDKITVRLSDQLRSRLRNLAAKEGVSRVTLTVDEVSVTYSLIQKGRLLLNSDGGPEWRTVASDEPLVERVMTITPDDSEATLADVSQGATLFSGLEYTDRGIFYIPVSLSGSPQTARLAIGYTVTVTGDSPASETGTAETTVEIDYDKAGRSQDFSLILDAQVSL